MKKLIILAVVLLFSGLSCKETSAPDYAPYVSVKSAKYGCTTLGNKTPGIPNVVNMDKALVIFEKHCKTLFPAEKCLQALKTVTIEWWGVITPSTSSGALMTVVIYKGKPYSGLTTLGDFKARVAWRGTIARSAFAHEILHIVGFLATGDGDGEHKKTEWWNLVGKMKAEMKIENL